MGNKNSVAPAQLKDGTSSLSSTRDSPSSAWEGRGRSNIFEVLELFLLVNSLPTSDVAFQKATTISREIQEEEIRIITKLRALADYLAKVHNDVLIADRVGTGVGIGAGAMTIGGLVAAPFTAGLSLSLTTTGIAAGIMGGVTSLGANLTGHLMLKSSLKKLSAESEQYFVKIEELSILADNSKYLVNATRFRPSLERLCKLSEYGFLEMLTTVQTLVSLALKNDYAQLSRTIDKAQDSKVKSWLEEFDFVNVDRAILNALAEVTAQIMAHVRSAMNAIKAVVNYLAKPELARMAMFFTSLNSGARAGAMAHEVAEVSTAFKGTPLAMSKAARGVAVAFTAAFIVVDVIHMIRICQETGETPTVQKLRSMADEMEAGLQNPKAWNSCAPP